MAQDTIRSRMRLNTHCYRHWFKESISTQDFTLKALQGTNWDFRSMAHPFRIPSIAFRPINFDRFERSAREECKWIIPLVVSRFGKADDCVQCLYTEQTCQSKEGSLMNTSIVLMSSSWLFLRARSVCTITLCKVPLSFSGNIRFINWRVSLNGISSGTGRNYKQRGNNIKPAINRFIDQSWPNTCVAEPNAWPKSIPIIPPVSISTIKFDKWRSPIPKMYWQMDKHACVRAKCDLKVRKASGEAESCIKARLWNKRKIESETHCTNNESTGNAEH